MLCTARSALAGRYIILLTLLWVATNDLLIYRQAIALYTTCRTLNFVLTPIWVRKKQARILSLVELTHLRGGPDHKRYLRLIDPNKRSQV